MSEFSNVDEVIAKLNNLADCLDFTRQGEEQSLGRDMAAETAVMISERAELEQDPTLAEWARNQGKYGAKKATLGLPVGRGTGPKPTKPVADYTPMLSLQLLKGRVETTKDQITLRYGLGNDNDRKAQWFTQGNIPGEFEHSGAKGIQPPRPFYEMTDPDMDWLAKMAEDGVIRFLSEEFGTTEKF